MTRRIKLIEIYTVILLTLLCVLGSGFFLGYSLGRVHGTKDALESKQEAEEYIKRVIYETCTEDCDNCEWDTCPAEETNDD